MSASGWEQLLFIVAVTAVAAPLLGRYLAATFRGAGASGTSVSPNRAPGDRVFLPVERLVYRTLGVDPDSSWTWRAYALAILALGLAGTCCCTPSCGCRECCPGTRRTPRGCRRCSRSILRSASSPAPTGRPTRGKRRPATSWTRLGWWSHSSPRPASDSRWRWPSSAASRERPARSVTSGSISPGPWCASSSRCRSSARW